MIDDRSGVLDLEATGGMGGRKMDQTRYPGPSAADRTTDLTGR